MKSPLEKLVDELEEDPVFAPVVDVIKRKYLPQDEEQRKHFKNLIKEQNEIIQAKEKALQQYREQTH